MHMSAGAYRDQNRAYDPLELESQPVVELPDMGAGNKTLGPLQEEWCS